jgi:hypothetical protein
LKLALGPRTPKNSASIRMLRFPAQTLDPDKVLIRHHGTIDKHHRRSARALLRDQSAPKVQQYGHEILVGHSGGTQAVDPHNEEPHQHLFFSLVPTQLGGLCEILF